MANTIRIPISSTIHLYNDGRSEIVHEEFADIPATETVARLFLSLWGTSPEEVVAACAAKAEPQSVK